MIVRIWEGLGNQMFQYAYARAMSLNYNKTVYLDYSGFLKEKLEGRRIKRHYGLDYFNISLPSAGNRVNKYKYLKRENLIDELLFYLKEIRVYPYLSYVEPDSSYKDNLKYANMNAYMIGWFQDERYFLKHKSVICKELTLKDNYSTSQRVDKLIRNDNTVSIHIRYGDYKTTGNVLLEDYYLQAMKVIEKYVSNPQYLVFSDDMPYAKHLFGNASNAILASEENLKDYMELDLMRKCKFHIISNSTFSWWGAYLDKNKNKLVVGPSNWFKYSSINPMPKGWIRI